MKKKIAMFAGGWGGEYLQEVICGIEEVAKTENVDVFVFINFSVPGTDSIANEREFELFTLPDIEDFDGLIILANSFNLPQEFDYFTEKIKNIKIPTVSIEYKLEDTVAVFSDNYKGMYDLAHHIITVHNVKNILFIGGPQNHMESAERLRALQDVAKENGLSIPKENIKYGDWAKNSAIRLLQEWMEENEGIPEAVVCANDVMAMGVCDMLEQLNYRIPEDVIVTGYDCLRLAQEYQPAIASVNHEWGRMGAEALQILMNKMRGEVTEDTILETRFVSGGSCGCKYDGDRRLQLARINRKNMIDGLTADSHFRHIYSAVRKAVNAQELSDGLANLFVHEHPMEGQNFMLCLNPEFFRDEGGESNFAVQGYSEQVIVIGAIQNGNILPCSKKSKKEAMTYHATEKDEAGVYLYLPIYSDTTTYGFAVLTSDLHTACDNQLYIWTRHVNQYLEQVRRNITIDNLTKRLTELSVTDTLTGVYNRAGCEKIAYPMLKNWKENGGTGVIMLVDIDKMKGINDRYGHNHGDLALCTVASVLKKELSEEWIISRFGGDEFFIGGCLSTREINLNALRESLEKRLEQEVKSRGITFRLTISVGSVLVQPEDDIEIEKYLQMADEDMYHVKNMHHKMHEER